MKSREIKAEKKPGWSEHFSSKVTKATGSTGAFVIAFGAVAIWAATGPFFHYSENWQLIINTGTTIITFLMVFLIQKAQNKDSMAIQLKLNELVAAHEFASNRLVNIENISEEELKVQKSGGKIIFLTCTHFQPIWDSLHKAIRNQILPCHQTKLSSPFYFAITGRKSCRMQTSNS